MRLKWTEIAFLISRLGKFFVPEPVVPFLDAIGLLPAVDTLRRAFTSDVKGLQERIFGWYQSELFAPYGVNEWRSVSRPDILFRPAPGLPPAPTFNYRGLMSLPAVVRDHLVLEPVKDLETIEQLSGNVLLVGGTRITPELREFLDVQSDAPFKFVSQEQIPEAVRPDTPPQSIRRVFGHARETYERTSTTGKYLVDSLGPDTPPYGPFVNAEGRITGDVLALTIARDRTGKRIVSANAGYGAADRLADVLCSGDVLEELNMKLPAQGAARVQAVFTLEVDHKDDGEIYGKPDLKAIRLY